MPVANDFTPRLMHMAAAARYIGVSVGTLDKLGIPRKIVRQTPKYDRFDLDAYIDGLPYEGDETQSGW